MEEVTVYQRTGVTVCGIADQRMADVGHVDSDLVGAARLQVKLQQAVSLKPVSNFVAGAGFFPANNHGHAGAPAGMAADRRVDLPLERRGRFFHQSQIPLGGLPRLDLSRKIDVSLVGLGHHHQP